MRVNGGQLFVPGTNRGRLTVSLNFPVSITGVGLLTPLGRTRESTWQALCAGGSIADLGQVPNLITRGEPRVNVLACQAAREAVADAGWNDAATQSAALIVGTSKGPVDAWLDTMATGTGEGADARIVLTSFGLAGTTDSIARALEVGGPRLLLSGACASGLLALIRGVMMIRAGEADRVLVVAAESSLHPLFTESFRRLGVIAPAGYGCRPFDRARAGFFISEAAAAVCLEATESSDVRKRAWAHIDRLAMGADGTHLTSGDADGKTLRRLLATAIDRRAIDLVHAHGTATLRNDPVELSAIEDALPPGVGDPASLYSSKGAIGHSLGAAGLVAIAINCLAHRDRQIPPLAGTVDPLPMKHVVCHQELHRRSVARSLAVAAGFGGAMAAVSLNHARLNIAPEAEG